MKARSLINRRFAAPVAAVALSATMAIGMAGCTAPASEDSASSSASDAVEEQTSDTDSSAASTSDTTEGHASSAAAANQSTTTSQSTAPEAQVTSDEALATALKRADLKKSDVQLIKNKLDYDDGLLTYEIEFIGPNSMEYEVEIDATNGEVLSFESEREDH